MLFRSPSKRKEEALTAARVALPTGSPPTRALRVGYMYTHAHIHAHTCMHTHMPGPGLSLLEHQGLGWDQYREHLCSVINGQATSAGGRGLSTLSATGGSLLRGPLPHSGESQGCQLASHELQLRTVTAGCKIKPVAPPTVHTASCPADATFTGPFVVIGGSVVLT